MAHEAKPATLMATIKDKDLENKFNEITKKLPTTIPKLFKIVSDWASWAIWDSNNSVDAYKSKYTLERLDWVRKNLQFIDLNPNIIIIGLNIASPCSNWSNFHSFKGQQYDRKLRYLFDNSSYRGAYMTDIYKKKGASSSAIYSFFNRPKNTMKRDDQFSLLKMELIALNYSENTLCILLGHKGGKLDNLFQDILDFSNFNKPKYLFYIDHCSRGSSYLPYLVENYNSIFEQCKKANQNSTAFPQNYKFDHYGIANWKPY